MSESKQHDHWEAATIGLQLERLRREDERGDRIARHLAMRLCARYGCPMPEWLAKYAEKDAAIALGELPPEKGQGRRTLEMRQLEIQEKRLVTAALLACKRAGLQGHERYEKLESMLADIGISREHDTLRSFKTIEPTYGDYEPFRKMLGLTEDLYGYLIEDDQ